ncbi:MULTISPECIES: hypothetical protein [Aquitalea]|uniref:hypothetical protein n=1 Tax=Aquitalea TaxID=407217 RepID=UPI001357F5FA|nr:MULTISPECIES: hypothetical protein [Aquitalea]
MPGLASAGLVRQGGSNEISSENTSICEGVIICDRHFGGCKQHAMDLDWVLLPKSELRVLVWNCHIFSLKTPTKYVLAFMVLIILLIIENQVVSTTITVSNYLMRKCVRIIIRRAVAFA